MKITNVFSKFRVRFAARYCAAHHWLLVIGFALALGCSQKRVLVSSVAGLPRYTPAESALFDDTIAPRALGLAPREAAPNRDPKIIERTQRADGVLPVRVATVNHDHLGQTMRYSLRLRRAGPPLAGRDHRGPLKVELGPKNPTLPFVRAASSRVVGAKLILFYRIYNDHGRAQLHFRAEPDSPAVREAVERAKAIGGDG